MQQPFLTDKEVRLLAFLTALAVLAVVVFLTVHYSGQECVPVTGPLVEPTTTARASVGHVCRDRTLFHR